VVSVCGFEVVFLEAFFLGDSRVFFGDFGDLGDLALFGDSLFFGDLVDLALAALAFFGEVASFLGLDVVDFLGEDVEAFFVTVFLVPFLAFVAFFGDLETVDDFVELDVDLFLGEDLA